MVMAFTTGRTIASSAEAILQLFNQVINTQKTTWRGALEDSLGRFKLWAGNIGALHKGRSSLDARLGHSDITDEVLHLLDELEESLQYLVGPFDDDDSQDQDSSDSENYADLLDTIAMTITNLLKITALIRHNPDRDPWKRILALPEWYTRPDVDNATMKYPKLGTSPWLADRLGLANSRRRQYFRTREEHIAKLGRPLKDQGQIEEETAPTTYQGNPKVTFSKIQDAGSDVAPSDTDFATEFGTDIATKMSIPPPPPDLGTKGAECTLCHNIIFISPNAWKKHVYRDLRPYVCVFKDCEFRVFDRRRDWQAHDLYEHRALFTCPICSKVHVGKQKLGYHLEQAHSGHFAESEREALLSSASASKAVLTASMCPFCDQWNEVQSRSMRALPDSDSKFRDGSPIVTEKAFARHIGQHMEQLSLFAIPKNYEEGEDAPEANDSSSSSSLRHGVEVTDNDVEKPISDLRGSPKLSNFAEGAEVDEELPPLNESSGRAGDLDDLSDSEMARQKGRDKTRTPRRSEAEIKAEIRALEEEKESLRREREDEARETERREEERVKEKRIVTEATEEYQRNKKDKRANMRLSELDEDSTEDRESKNSEAYRQRVQRAQAIMLNYEEKDKKPTLKVPRSKGKTHESSVKSTHAPVYPRMHGDDIEIETLTRYDVPWEWYSEDRDYIVLLEELSVEEADILFEHTKKIRKERRKRRRQERGKGSPPRPTPVTVEEGDYAYVRRRSHAPAPLRRRPLLDDAATETEADYEGNDNFASTTGLPKLDRTISDTQVDELHHPIRLSDPPPVPPSLLQETLRAANEARSASPSQPLDRTVSDAQADELYNPTIFPERPIAQPSSLGDRLKAAYEARSVATSSSHLPDSTQS